MYRAIAMILNLILTVAFGSEPAKAPQAWDAKSITWQKVDPDGTKWAVLQGRSDVTGEVFTTRRLFLQDFMTFMRMVATPEWPWFKAY